VKAAFALSILLLQAGCSSDEAVGGGEPPSDGDLATILEKTLEDLTPAESEALCREDNLRTDWCTELGVRQVTPERCREVVSSCDAVGAEPPAIDCAGIDFGPPGSCPVSVAEYLGCVHAWSAHRTCENVGRLVDPPEQCRRMVEVCPQFRNEFSQEGEPPACDRDRSLSVQPIDDAKDVHGADGCRPLPERLIVLGDSIAACYFISRSSDCGPLRFGEYLKTRYAPDLTVESHARSGAFTAELPEQARTVEGGPGHVLVWVFAIGNDLITRRRDYPGWEAAWAEVFDYFGDKARFPGGATFLLNTQYSPYDQCPDPPGPNTGISMTEEEWLQEVNRRLFIDVAIRRDDTVAVDHYPGWLGHGTNANIRGCPHCQADNTPWTIQDGHPNALGQSRIADKAQVAADGMYGLGCKAR
jgi:hypothetical protein